MFGMRIAALAAAMLLWLSAASVSSAGLRIVGPTVVNGFKKGPVLIADSTTPQLVASMPLPAGLWVAWAKFYVDIGSAQHPTDVICTLGTGARSPTLPAQRGEVHLGPSLPDGGFAGLDQTFSLSNGAQFGSLGGRFVISCGADSGGATANWIRIEAVRVGTLVANGKTIGSGAPRVVIQDIPSAPMALYELSPVGSFDVAGGRWFISASFTIDAMLLGEAQCELWVDRQPQDSSYALQLAGKSMALLQGVAGTLTRTAIKLSIACVGDASYPFQPVAQYIRVTALSLGTLVTYDRYGNAVSLGTGTPKALHVAPAPRAITRQTWFPIASLDLSQGAWMVFAKAETSRGPINCQVDELSSFDQVALRDAYYGDIGLAVVHKYPYAAKTRFRCIAAGASSTNPAVIRSIKLTAFRLGSLTSVAI
jgi:hypothetical protein